jgi:urea transport system permease protein
LPKPIRLKLILTAVILLAFALAPLLLSEFRLSLLGKFLSFAILAIGLDLIWGYAGILSLGHGVYFGLGAYCMAMHLKLVSSKDGLPDFMSWSGVEKLPWFWVPFHSTGIAIALALLIPMLLAALLGYLTFRSRIRGAFFSILSQATVIVLTTLFIGQQGYTGGTNGLTNFSTFVGIPLRDPTTKLVLYYITLGLVVLVLWLCVRLVTSRFGKTLVAIRDSENRTRFLGYNPVAFKTFAYSISAGLAGLAGIMFVLQEGIISPAQMGIIPSIEMVLWVAIGGRATLYGAVIGTIVTNIAKTGFSEAYPNIWPFFIGSMFVIVVLFMPKGIVGSIKRMKGESP